MHQSVGSFKIPPFKNLRLVCSNSAPAPPPSPSLGKKICSNSPTVCKSQNQPTWLCAPRPNFLNLDLYHFFLSHFRLQKWIFFFATNSALVKDISLVFHWKNLTILVQITNPSQAQMMVECPWLPSLGEGVVGWNPMLQINWPIILWFKFFSFQFSILKWVWIRFLL